MSLLEACFVRAAEDRRHGASEIERRLIADLLRERRWWTPADLVSGAAIVAGGQPAMANLRNLARQLEHGDPLAVAEWLRRRSALLADLDERLAASAWPLIEGAKRIVTISRSSAVAAVLEGAWRCGWRGQTVVFDGVPAGSGADQAVRLAAIMNHLHNPPDATIPGWLTGAGIVVVVGADAVSPLRMVNAGGTRRLLESASARSLPAVVVADSGKNIPDDEIDMVLASGPEVVDEGTGRHRPIFEMIPFDLVSTRISE